MSTGYIYAELRAALRPGYVSLDSAACMRKIGSDLLEREKITPNRALAPVNHFNIDQGRRRRFRGHCPEEGGKVEQCVLVEGNRRCFRRGEGHPSQMLTGQENEERRDIWIWQDGKP